MVRASPCSADDLEAVAGVQALRRVLAVHAQADRPLAIALGPGDHRAQQQRADALAAELGIHADRELGDVVGDVAVAGRGGGEPAEPRRADRLVAAVERVQRDVAGRVPSRRRSARSAGTASTASSGGRSSAPSSCQLTASYSISARNAGSACALRRNTAPA